MANKIKQSPELKAIEKPVKNPKKAGTLQRMMDYRKRYPSPEFKLENSETNSYTIANEDDENFGQVMIVETTGFNSSKAGLHLLDQAVNAHPQSARDYTKTAAFLHEIAPQDGLEGMLAGQMVACHAMAMEYSRRAMMTDRTDLGESYINRASKLMRIFNSQIETLNKYRNKGQQNITVQHVNVNDGGQAVVGNINQGGRDANKSQA